MLGSEEQVWFHRCRMIHFMKKNCPRVWALLNQKAKHNPPRGIEELVSGRWGAEGRRQLQLADARISALIAKTSEKIVGDAYRRDLSGVGTEHQLAELLCEITVVDALGGISDTQPILRPDTGAGKQCDVKVVVGGCDVYGEVKRLADAWKGGVRSIAKSAPSSKPSNAARPRAMDLFSKLKEVHAQFPRNTLNIVFLLHPSVWNSPVYIRQALFGDASGFDKSSELALQDDGLFALHEWRTISACAHSRVNTDGTLSIVQLWKNPKASVALPENVRESIAIAG
jgi:hypothetical protein